jgi:hypothetical protein
MWSSSWGLVLRVPTKGVFSQRPEGLGRSAERESLKAVVAALRPFEGALPQQLLGELEPRIWRSPRGRRTTPWGLRRNHGDVWLHGEAPGFAAGTGASLYRGCAQGTCRGPSPQPRQAFMPDKLRVVVVGAGRWFRSAHLPGFERRARIRGRGCRSGGRPGSPSRPTLERHSPADARRWPWESPALGRPRMRAGVVGR